MMTYAAYMQSKAWRARRDAYFRKHTKACRACETTEQIHLHHLDYARMGKEPDRDLMPLCEACHDLLHRLHRANEGMSLRDATHKAIQWGANKTERQILRKKGGYEVPPKPRRKKHPPVKYERENELIRARAKAAANTEREREKAERAARKKAYHEARRQEDLQRLNLK